MHREQKAAERTLKWQRRPGSCFRLSHHFGITLEIGSRKRLSSSHIIVLSVGMGTLVHLKYRAASGSEPRRGHGFMYNGMLTKAEDLIMERASLYSTVHPIASTRGKRVTHTYLALARDTRRWHTSCVPYVPVGDFDVPSANSSTCVFCVLRVYRQVIPVFHVFSADNSLYYSTQLPTTSCVSSRYSAPSPLDAMVITYHWL